MKNGVIDTATGDLLRYGFCDFENDGSFDATTETALTGLPAVVYTKKKPGQPGFHRWNGSSWSAISPAAKEKLAVLRDPGIHGNPAISEEDEIQYTRVNVAPGQYDKVRLHLEKAPNAFDVYVAVYATSGDGFGSQLTTGSLSVAEDTPSGNLDVALAQTIAAVSSGEYWIGVLIDEQTPGNSPRKVELISTIQAFGREHKDVRFEDGSSLPATPTPDETKRASVFYAALVGT